MLYGKVINGYALCEPLGEGGMAEVWRAESSLGKSVSVKLLKAEYVVMDNIVSRFENEARVMSRLDHPNIRGVYDYGTIEGRPAIVMEYLDGEDFSSMLKRGYAFRDTQLKDYWTKLVQALRHTHAKGIVHRDIKPSNIFLTKSGEVKLLDFGVAKTRSNLTHTKTGMRIGTPLYMSPEQVKDSKHLDYKTDIYSLAVTFYHLLTGVSPYDYNTTSEFEIQLKICQEPLDLSRLPQAWQSLLLPLLEKEPKLRGELCLFYEKGSKDSKTSIEEIQSPSKKHNIEQSTKISESSQNKVSSGTQIKPKSGATDKAKVLIGLVLLILVYIFFVEVFFSSNTSDYDYSTEIESDASFYVDSTEVLGNWD